MYATLKEGLRWISMYRSGVLTRAKLQILLRENLDLLSLCVEELHVPVLDPYDGMLDILDWVLRRKVIYGALKQTIDAHGPITGTWIGSAAKRITGMMRKRILTFRKIEQRRRKGKS